MRVLLDECLPKRLKDRFPGHAVRTVPEMGWAGLKNGELLRRAESQFDVFVTADRNLPHQQSLTGRSIAVVILAASNTRLDTLAALLPKVETVLASIQPGTFELVEE